MPNGSPCDYVVRIGSGTIAKVIQNSGSSGKYRKIPQINNTPVCSWKGHVIIHIDDLARYRLQ